MQTPPLLTDRAALLRNRARARETFLHALVFDEVQERLKEVNRTFTRPLIVSGCARIWQGMGPVIPDDEVLAAAPAGHDLVIHALALHWANDPVGQLVQCRRALAPDGLFLGLLFGGQTLAPMRSALAEAEAEITGGLSPRVLPMADIRALGALLQRAGFALPVADSFVQDIAYRDPLALMHDLRRMGEGNALAGRLRHPTRAAVLHRAAALMDQRMRGTDGMLHAGFEIICLTGWAPDDSQQKPLRPGSAAARLADALGSRESPLPRDALDG